MNRFVIQRNIQRYHAMLEIEPDEGRRKMLLDLLAEEEAKSAEINAKPNISRPC
jgi:hypothetical protein